MRGDLFRRIRYGRGSISDRDESGLAKVDFDGIGLEDLLYLTKRWMALTPETVGAADGHADGRADLLDLAVLSENWNP